MIDPISLFAVISSISLLAGFLVGIRTERTHGEPDRAWLRSELAEANDRLFAASREPGVIVPPRDTEAEPAIELPSELEHLIADWEGAQTQELLREQFMSLLQEGYSVSEITRRHLES